MDFKIRAISVRLGVLVLVLLGTARCAETTPLPTPESASAPADIEARAQATPVEIEGVPSEAQITQALLPTGGGGGGLGVTRGIRRAPVGDPAVSLQIEFRSGSADVDAASQRKLQVLGQALSSPALSSFRFRIEGHTDTMGNKAGNQALSDQRARRVVAYLVSRFHIAPQRLDAVGLGEDGLLVQTGAQTAEPRNRRVQIVNLGS